VIALALDTCDRNHHQDESMKDAEPLVDAISRFYWPLKMGLLGDSDSHLVGEILLQYEAFESQDLWERPERWGAGCAREDER
jgi:hypothetical protein